MIIANIEGLAKGTDAAVKFFKQGVRKLWPQSLFYPALRIRKVQAKGQNVDALQAKFEGIVH